MHVILAHLSRIGELEIQRRRRSGVSGCGMLPVSFTRYSTVRLVTALARSLKSASAKRTPWPRKERVRPSLSGIPQPGAVAITLSSVDDCSPSKLQQPKRMHFSRNGIPDVLKIEEHIIDSKFVHDTMLEQRISPSRKAQNMRLPRDGVPRSG